MEMHRTAVHSELNLRDYLFCGLTDYSRREERSVFNVDSWVFCCNLYLAVISVVNVCFYKKTEIKDEEEPRMSDLCLFTW